MKKLLMMMPFAFAMYVATAQSSWPDWDGIRLELKEDYNAGANDAAMQASRYLFAHPINEADKLRASATRYLISWMTGSPDYSFTLDAKAMKFAKGNDDWLSLYLAGMIQYALEKNAPKADPKLVTLEACNKVIAYAKNPDNNIKPNAELKKMMKAADEGKLKEYLKQ